MDNINGLPDDLLVKILSFLPTKVSVSTSVLSKRWEFLWMWLPKLKFNHRQLKPGLGDFINKKLTLHKARVIESLLLNLRHISHTKRDDIKRLIGIAVSRYVREVEIEYGPENGNIFPSNLFSSKSLVILKLKHVTLMDVSSMVCLPCLKTMQLQEVKFVDDKSLQQLLSICPGLEDLSVTFYYNCCLEFTIIIPSLQSLSLLIPYSRSLLGYKIDTPSLKYLKLVDWNKSDHYCLMKNMPKLREAYVDVVGFPELKCLFGSITSVKRLTICCLEDLYGDDCVFKELEYLNLCVCKRLSSEILEKLLKTSPNLRVLNISLIKDHGHGKCNDATVCSTCVPECLLSTLQVFKWSRYIGRPQDRDIAVYILKNAFHLKKATILVDTQKDYVTRLEMIKELTLSPRASSTCQLVFDEDLGS